MVLTNLEQTYLEVATPHARFVIFLLKLNHLFKTHELSLFYQKFILFILGRHTYALKHLYIFHLEAITSLSEFV